MQAVTLTSGISTDEVLYQFGTFHISYLEGKLLTLIDASTPDKEQRKALKDIVRGIVWNWATENNQAAAHPHNQVPHAGTRTI